jgi:hypothetical protein
MDAGHCAGVGGHAASSRGDSVGGIADLHSASHFRGRAGRDPGMLGTSYLYTMDGMNDNDNSDNLSRAGTLFLLLGQSEIQEATIVSKAS